MNSPTDVRAGAAEAVLAAILADPRYQENVQWGHPRPGHPEGPISEHVAQLLVNLARVESTLSDDEIAWLRVIIHVHDTFKKDARRGSAILDPDSHSSLARAFAAEFGCPGPVLAMIQYHDYPYAMWRAAKRGTRPVDRRKAEELRGAIGETHWRMFLAFQVVDACIPGKSLEPLRWFLRGVTPLGAPRLEAARILDPEGA